jgi:hypothetical protein
MLPLSADCANAEAAFVSGIVWLASQNQPAIRGQFAFTSLKAKERAMTKIRTALIGSAILATLLATSSTGFAQGTPEQRSACMGDAFKFCSAEIPNIPRITSCMKANYSKLSPACKAVAPRVEAGARQTVDRSK